MTKHHIIYGIMGVMFAYDLKVNIQTRKVAMDLYRENEDLRDRIAQKDKELRFMAEELKKAGVTPDGNYAVR